MTVLQPISSSNIVNVVTKQRNIEIDNLRGIAIVMVMISHLPALFFWNPHFLTFLNQINTWTGVDLFFVISGYVVSSSLVGLLSGTLEKDQKVSIVKAFYMRRFFRLFPACAFVLLVLLFCTKFLNQNGGFGGFEQNLSSAFAVITYWSNIWWYQVASHVPPLPGLPPTQTPYWSLSLEEQFYLIFPILLIALTKNKHRIIFLVLFLIVGVFWHRPFQGSAPAIGWYLRYDALCVGILLYFLDASGIKSRVEPVFLKKNKWLAVIIFLLAISALCLIPVYLSQQASYLTLIAVSAGVLVWLASYSRGYIYYPEFIKKVLAWMGSRSYSIYLCHLLCFFLLKEFWFLGIGPSIPSLPYKIGYVIIAVVFVGLFSEFLHSVFEVPFIKLGKRYFNSTSQVAPMTVETSENIKRESHMVKIVNILRKTASKIINEKTITVGYIAVFLMSILAIYMTASYTAQMILFNSDILWIEDYLRDWLVRGLDMRTWNAPGAPNFFPEMLIYAVFRYVTGSVYGAYIGFGLVKIGFYLIIFYKFLSMVTNLTKVRKLWVSLLSVSLLILTSIELGREFNYTRMLDFWQFFSPGGHGGAITNVLIAIGLLLYWLRNPRRGYLWLFLLFLLSIIASLSDRLYVIWFVLPALGSIFILFLIKRVDWKSALLLAGVLLIPDVISRKIAVWMFPLQIIPYKLAFTEGLKATAKFYQALLAEGWYHPLVLLSYVCLVGITIYVLIMAWQARNRQTVGQVFELQETAKFFFLPYAVLVLPISFFAMSLINRPETQYFTGGDLLALSVWAFVLTMTPFGLRLWAKRWFHAGVITTLVGYLGFLAVFSPAPLPSMLFTIPNPYSELTACLDSHTKSFDGGAGLADYWQARRINLFSQKGLRIDQASGSNLQVFQWASNQEMLAARKHTFVVTNTPTNLPQMLEDNIVRIYGKPDVRFICAGYPILVYRKGLPVTVVSNNSPPLPVTMKNSDQNFIANKFDEIFSNRQIQMLTDGGKWRQDALHSSGKAGWLLFGPYITLSPGTYRIEWEGKVRSVKPEEIGSVDVTYNMGKNVLTRAIITQKSLSTMPSGQLALQEFSVDQDISLVEFRFYVNQKVRLQINQIAITYLGTK